MFYVVNDHLGNLYVLSNKAIGPGKESKINKLKLRAYVYSLIDISYGKIF